MPTRSRYPAGLDVADDPRASRPAGWGGAAPVRSDAEPVRETIAEATDSTLTAAGIGVELAASESRGATASSAHLGPVLLVLLGVALPVGMLGPSASPPP